MVFVQVEVGGKGKGREQFKGVTVGRKLVFAHLDVPTKGRDVSVITVPPAITRSA